MDPDPELSKTACISPAFSLLGFLGGGNSKNFLFSPRSLGKSSNLTSIFFSIGLKPPTRFVEFVIFYGLYHGKSSNIIKPLFGIICFYLFFPASKCKFRILELWPYFFCEKGIRTMEKNLRAKLESEWRCIKCVMSVGSHFWREWGLESPDGFQNILIFLLEKISWGIFPSTRGLVSGSLLGFHGFYLTQLGMNVFPLPSFESKGYNSQMPPPFPRNASLKKGMIHHHDPWNSMPKITGAHAATATQDLFMYPCQS